MEQIVDGVWRGVTEDGRPFIEWDPSVMSDDVAFEEVCVGLPTDHLYTLSFPGFRVRATVIAT